MSYYDSPQWSSPGQSSWDHPGSSSTGTSTPVRAGMLRPSSGLGAVVAETDRSTVTGASAPQSQDDYAFFYQFDGMLPAHHPRIKPSKRTRGTVNLSRCWGLEPLMSARLPVK